MRVYLAGPINSVSDQQAHAWRDEVMMALGGRGITFVNPMVRDYRGHEDENTTAIVEGDLADIASCDVLLAYCWKPSYGTAMEIRHASAEVHIPVVVVTAAPVSPWLRYHATELYPSLGDAVVAIALRAQSEQAA